jgi:REP element-mobilizing transposase RayT
VPEWTAFRDRNRRGISSLIIKMPRRLRFHPPGSLVEITCRTVQGRLLLHPSPLVSDLVQGVLARAARLYPVQIHAFVFLSNHYHLLLTVDSAQRLARFMNYLNSNLAREVGRAIHWRERFWGRRYQAILVSDEEAAQVERLAYILSHGCKEHLVERPTDWPGPHCARALRDDLAVTGRWFDRTLEYRAARRRLRLGCDAQVSREELRLAPLPCWAALSAESRRERIAHLLRSIERETQRRTRDAGRPPLGREAMLRQDPHSRPNRVRKSSAPLVHAASRYIRRQLCDHYRAFAAAFWRAAERLRSGARDVEFPIGSFPPSLPFVTAPESG